MKIFFTYIIIIIKEISNGVEAMKLNGFLFDMILSELEDAVGRENCSIREIDKLVHSVDYFWLSRMWADRGERMLKQISLSPKDAKETSAILKINYYKIPVTTRAEVAHKAGIVNSQAFFLILRE